MPRPVTPRTRTIRRGRRQAHSIHETFAEHANVVLSNGSAILAEAEELLHNEVLNVAILAREAARSGQEFLLDREQYRNCAC